MNAPPNPNIVKSLYLSLILERWRVFHIFLMVIALATSFAGFFSFMTYDNQFDADCPLFSTIHVMSVIKGNKTEFAISSETEGGREKTIWSPRITCDFARYSPIVSVVAGLIGILLLSSTLGKSEIPENASEVSGLRLIHPFCVVGFLLAGLSLSTCIVVNAGGSVFCNSFRTTVLKNCTIAERSAWSGKEKIYNFLENLTRAQTLYWMNTHVWIIQSVLFLLRWITDADRVIAEERELYGNPEFTDIGFLGGFTESESDFSFIFDDGENRDEDSSNM